MANSTNNHDKLRERFTVLAILAVLLSMAYLIWFHPRTSSIDTGSSLKDTPTYYQVTGDGQWSYIALAASIGDGSIVDITSAPFRASSAAEPEIDRSVDTAWVAVARHWGCPVEAELTDLAISSSVTLTYAELEGKELAVPYGVSGYSGGLVYALAQASYASGYEPNGLIAATGAVSADGSLVAVNSVNVKAIAASAAGATDLYVPHANVADALSTASEDLNVVGVGSVSEMLNRLGFPSSINCDNA